jgi:hypothetical protein
LSGRLCFGKRWQVFDSLFSPEQLRQPTILTTDQRRFNGEESDLSDDLKWLRAGMVLVNVKVSCY